MNNDFNYYLILEANTGRTPLLTYDDDMDENEEIGYLYDSTRVPDDTITHLSFREKIRKPDMNTDCLTLVTFNVFSKKVRDALEKHMPINCLQLVQASIEKGEYMDFFIANVYQDLYTFDRTQCEFGDVNEGDDWEDITKIVLDKKLLSKIPLEDRLVYRSKEDSQFKLYHESIVNIIKSVNPVGMAFLNIEEWNEGSLFDFMR